MAAVITCRSSIVQMVTCCSTCSLDCGPGPTQSTWSEGQADGECEGESKGRAEGEDGDEGEGK
eukprot:scaffold98098_cov33-Phaeocystis_antarctica.AAC.1